MHEADVRKYDVNDQHANRNADVLIFEDDADEVYFLGSYETDDYYELCYHRIGNYAHHDKDFGEISYWINNICYNNVALYCEACGFDEETTFMWVLKYGERLPVLMEEL